MQARIKWTPETCGFLTAINLLVLLLFSASSALASSDIAALIKKLDRSEWEIVSEAITERLPNLISGKAERAYFNKMMQASQDVAAMAEALEFGNYEGLGAISANIAARDLEKMVASRFGETSRLYRTIQIVKQDPELAKALTRAALNADAYAANRAIRSSLRKYAESRAAELLQRGKNFWKDMVRSVIPGGGRLAGLGFDPVDIYLQGISDWSDFTARTRLRFNNTMLDCLAIRYRKVLDEGYDRGGARLEVENFDTGTGFGGSFNCSVEMDRLEGRQGDKSAARRLTDFFTRSGRSTAALGELNMTASEIVDLIEQYEDEGGRDKTARFSSWLQNRLLTNIKTRAKGLTGTIAESQKRVAKAQIAEANRLLQAIKGEIGRLDRRKGPDNPQIAAGGKAAGEGDGGEGTDETGTARDADGTGNIEPPATPKCDQLTGLVASIGRSLAGARPGDPGLLIANLGAAVAGAQEEGACAAQVFADAADIEARLQAIAGLLRRANAAVASCNIDAIPSLLSEMSSLSPVDFANEKSLLQTAKTGVILFQTGRAAYDNDNYANARSGLGRSLEAFGELPPGACQTYADRARRGLEIIAKIEAEQARVNRAINACDLADMDKIMATYPGRKNRFFARALGRVKAAIADCKKNDRIIAAGKFCEAARATLNAARADFLANRLNRARRQLLELVMTLSPDKTEYCPELNPRARRGLANIAGLAAENKRLRRAVATCDVKRLRVMEASFGGKSHPWYVQASARAAAAADKCRPNPPAGPKPPRVDAACQKVVGIVRAARKEMAAGQVVVALRGLYAADLAAGESCQELEAQIGNEIAAAEAVEAVLARTESAIATCDSSAFGPVAADLGKISHPVASAALAKLNSAVETCDAEDPGTEDRDREAEAGEIVTAGRTEVPGAGGTDGLDGIWVLSGRVEFRVGGKRTEQPVNFDFSVNGGRVSVRESKKNPALRGRVNGDQIQFAGQKYENGATVGAELKGTLQEDGTLSGRMALLLPELNCLAKGLGEAIGSAIAGAEDTSSNDTCPTVRYPGTWTATRR